MECLDNPAVAAFLRNEMYCDWRHALNIGWWFSWYKRQDLSLIPKLT